MNVEDFRRKGYLYKYRSLENLERFLSIIIDKKLYGALYNEMNDPMEGYFLYNKKYNLSSLLDIINEKQRTYICSLSRQGNIGLMWTHYADENKGCCIEIKNPTASGWKEVPVIYSVSLPNIDSSSTAEDILKTKSSVWKYEKEIRYLCCPITYDDDRPQLDVEISRVFVGYKVEEQRYRLIEKIIKALDHSVEVIKMSKEWLDYGYEGH